MIVQTEAFSAARQAAFAERLLGILNGGGLALMVSVGHRTGLFDAMEPGWWATSAELAARAGLHERYVREWLGAMATGRIVEHDAESGRFCLPAEHAAHLTRAAKQDNIAVLSQYIGVLAAVEDQIVERFRSGGGVGYCEFHRFHDVMAEDSGQSAAAALESAVLPLIPGIIEKLESGISVADVGCGCGRIINLLARRFPKSRFTGMDFSEEAIGKALAEAEAHGTTNARFELKDAAAIDMPGRFDLVLTFDAIHDQADPKRVLANIRAMLKPGGVYMMQDIGLSSHVHKNMEHPVAPLIYTISCMHCMTVSLAQGGAGLGAAWGVELAERMLREAGFSQISIHRLPHDIQNAYFVASA
ncbi:MAG: class I SAM-dependent methyltransferase [Planctomycetota bacterium]|nr:class I SAM-dependent methyltransferase [Planctomycetota bacterium]